MDDLCDSGVIDSPSVSGGEAVFGEFPRAPQSFHRDKRPGNEVLGVPANYCYAWFYFYYVQSRDIHAASW